MVLDESPPAGDNRDGNACDVSQGEYAMLVGYTTLGTALWQCVQLYRQFRDTIKLGEFGLSRQSVRMCLCAPLRFCA